MSGPPGPTLNDVADLAGVSRMTVSRVLRNLGHVSPEMRERVERAVHKLGYRPNPMVSAFMAYVRSGVVKEDAGVLAYLTSNHQSQDWKRHDTFLKFYEGALARATELGYKLEEFKLRQPGLKTSRLGDILYARGISGLIVAPMSSAHSHLNLDWEKFSAVAIGYSLLRPSLARVCNDQFSTILIAMRELWHLGYRRIALAMPHVDDARVHYHWSSGYFSFYQRRGVKKIPPPFLPREWKNDLVPGWINKCQPDAIVTTHASLLDTLRLKKFRIPAELGYAQLDWSPQGTPCAGVDQSPRDIGEAAVDVVVEQVNHNRVGIPARQRTLVMPGVWMPGPTVRNQRAPL